jgi:hypothetical protein
VKSSRFQVRFGLTLWVVFFTPGCIHTTAPIFSKGQLSETVGKTGDAVDPDIGDPATVVHIDPKTGKIIAPSSATLPGQVAQPPARGVKKPPAELRETLSPVPAPFLIRISS